MFDCTDQSNFGGTLCGIPYYEFFVDEVEDISKVKLYFNQELYMSSIIKIDGNVVAVRFYVKTFRIVEKYNFRTGIKEKKKVYFNPVEFISKDGFSAFDDQGHLFRDYVGMTDKEVITDSFNIPGYRLNFIECAIRKNGDSFTRAYFNQVNRYE